MWCPRCGKRCEEDFLICDACGGALIPDTDEPGKEDESQANPVHLAVVYGPGKVQMVEDALNKAAIPYTKENMGSIEYVDAYDGDHLYGMDFFVPEELLSDAQDAINDLPDDILIVQKDEDGETGEINGGESILLEPEKPRRKPARITLLYLLLAIGLPVLALVILGIVGVI
jgi:hypothetical protein